MANAGPGTNGSQFFITFAPTPWLDGRHTVFGKVIKGLDVVLSLTLRDPQFATETGDILNEIKITESEVSLLPTATPISYVQPGEISMPENPQARNGMYAGKLPAMIIDPQRDYTAVMELENGEITIELFAQQVPKTVNNFVFLAREGFYNDTTFHRVIEGFMAQAGDPTATGGGGPGYRFADEFDTNLKHDAAGILSMANAGANTNGSQFFITFDATPWLDNAHSVFGKVIDGYNILEKIKIRDPQTASEPGDKILTITIIEE
jgi:cyclophilin family peptidyl-prolyl cis-trans isomerase